MRGPPPSPRMCQKPKSPTHEQLWSRTLSGTPTKEGRHPTAGHRSEARETL